MDKETAYNVMGLDFQAERYQVEIRYLLLMKRLKLEDSKRYSKELLNMKIDELNHAYDVIIDRCVNEEILDGLYPKKKKGFPYRLLSLILDGIQSFIVNNKYKLLFLVSILVAVFVIMGIMTYKHPDLKIQIIKDTSFDKNLQVIETDKNFTKEIKKRIISSDSNIRNPEVYINSEYYDFDAYSVQKVALEIFGKGTDVIIIEESELDKYCKLGGFIKLDALASELGVTKVNGKGYYFRLKRKEDKFLFGVHVENSPILKGIWTDKKPKIAVVMDGSKFQKTGLEFIKLLSGN